MDSSTTKKTLEIFREEARQDKKTIWMFSTLIPLSHFLYIVLLPLLISFIIQSLVIEPDNLATPLWLVGGMVIVAIVSPLIQHVAYIKFFNHEEQMTTRLTDRAMNGLLQHSHSFFANQKIGSLAGDVNTFSRSYLMLVDTIFLQASNILVSFITSLIIIAFIAPVLLPPLFLLTFFIIFESITSLNRRAAYRNQRKELQSKLFGTIADILGNQVLVRLFGRASNELNSITKERVEIEHVARKEIAILQRSAEIRQSILFVFQILTILFAIYFFNKDLVSIGALIFMVTYLGRVTGSMFNINSIIRTSEQAFLDAAKVTDILSKQHDITDHPESKLLTVKDGAIHFKNVSFRYEENDTFHVFKNLDLSIDSGQRVGLVGRSGSGKTTLSQLLLRYMDTSSGLISIDSQDIKKVTQDSLRQAISFVPQDPYLFHRSLRENIAYGNITASDAEILKAAKQAHAMEFIDTLPEGINTIVGERGIKLSGGQRQRIAIARAILRNAPILLLDEATSALDSESEKLIQSSLDVLMKGKTSIVIAHRLSTIQKLDRIIVLDNGKIVEDGTHAELLKQKGTYAKLWAHQSGGFIED